MYVCVCVCVCVCSFIKIVQLSFNHHSFTISLSHKCFFFARDWSGEYFICGLFYFSTLYICKRDTNSNTKQLRRGGEVH